MLVLDGDPGRSRKQKIECDTEIGKVFRTGRAGMPPPIPLSVVGGEKTIRSVLGSILKALKHKPHLIHFQEFIIFSATLIV